MQEDSRYLQGRHKALREQHHRHLTWFFTRQHNESRGRPLPTSMAMIPEIATQRNCLFFTFHSSTVAPFLTIWCDADMGYSCPDTRHR